MDTCAFLSSFTCSNRTLLIDGKVELKRGLQRQERHLFLFNDLFVVAKIKYNNNFKIKNKIKLSDMWTANCVDEVEEGNTNTMKSFVLGWPTVNFVATFSFPEQKDKWLSLLQRYINAEKEKDYPKSIPLKIFTKDIGNCAYSKTITIKNSDTASEVINMSLSILGITGSERDYQLWVNSGKEEAPYPLIGHEYPYGIKMSHLRDTALLAELSKDSTSPSSLQEPFLIEQLPREMQCQFILKPSRLAETQQLSDSGQKTSKRRRSIINWVFWRGSSTHLDNSPISPTSPMLGQLFGVSLPSLCENDNLPKPVLDMLCFLSQKGPHTKGIFRLSANVKSCRELKEKLNSGSEVHLDCESVFVIASVLKDFLRNIPGSVFSSDLYDHWICVMDQGNDEEKINTIQRLLDQLPRANVVLLRYLFGVLYNIEQQSSSNQMTAFNLAVCIAPSILWPPTSSSPELENEFTKKSLSGEVSVRCNTKENASDIPCFQMNDSSYDSLENELNEDVDAPCSDVIKKLGQGSRSMDSVLTLSDYDLDQPEVEGLLTLSDFNLDHSKHEEFQMDLDLDNSKHEEFQMDLDLDNSKHEDFQMELDIDHPKHEDIQMEFDLDHSKPEDIQMELDLDHLKHEDFQMERPLESKPVTAVVLYGNATLQGRARPSANMNTSCCLSTAAADGPKSPRRVRRCSEPSTNYVDSKLSFLREFYRKKKLKSSYDPILSQEDEDYLKQNQPLQEESKVCLRQNLGIGTDIKKNATNKIVKKKSSSGNEGNHVKLFSKSKPVAISVASYSHVSSYDHPRNVPFDSGTSGYSPAHTTDALKSSRRHRRCSEPIIHDQHCKLSHLGGIYSKKQHKTSYEADHFDREDDYLKRHKSLQMEGQKLINQSLVMGIEVGKSSAVNQTTEKFLPSSLNTCPSTSSSSLSSPGTSPSGSSGRSQDSAFSQISEHFVFTPTDTSSPIDCTFQAQRKQEELSSDLSSSSLISGMPGPSSRQSSNNLVHTNKDTIECHSHSVTLHPITWLRNGMASLKNWSLRKKPKAYGLEEKKIVSLKRFTEPPPHASGVPEARSLQEKKEDIPLRAAEELEAVQAAECCSSYPSQDSEKCFSSALNLVEDSLKLCMQSHEEGQSSGQCSSDTLPCVKSSPCPSTE
ncbi:Rho GTPase-activating protein 20 [Pteropus alecto]|uniref:Rho GTPase-activating protein 20 n=1 Tax=Pteropus alecto TaxID=9402 RepID=L5KK75_PTEAL|nr:Rho GTPase-activating protein 20 [Pteropus alecto]